MIFHIFSLTSCQDLFDVFAVGGFITVPACLFPRALIDHWSPVFGCIIHSKLTGQSCSQQTPVDEAALVTHTDSTLVLFPPCGLSQVFCPLMLCASEPFSLDAELWPGIKQRWPVSTLLFLGYYRRQESRAPCGVMRTDANRTPCHSEDEALGSVWTNSWHESYHRHTLIPKDPANCFLKR